MAGPSEVSSAPDYQTDFLRILNNLAKSKTDDPAARRRGFVVVVRGASSLAPLQKLCFDDRQKHNRCETARYRLPPDVALGTLLLALASDLNRIFFGGDKISGNLMPAGSEFNWKQLAVLTVGNLGMRSVWPGQPTDPSTPIDEPTARELTERTIAAFRAVNLEMDESKAQEFLRSVKQVVPTPQGELGRDQMSRIFSSLSHKSALGVGERLILFAELSEQATDLSAWQTAHETLFAQLPERMGVVLSGAPADFALPKDDPHFLEITVPSDYGAKEDSQEITYKYTDSSFHSDEPAKKDELGVNDYANAIARFLLHPQTNPPLTIGIHGPWGKGKSSFMKLIDSALVKHAEANNPSADLNSVSRLQKLDELVKELLRYESETLVAYGDQAGVTKEEDDADKEERQRKAEYDRNRKAQEELWETMKKEAERNVISVTFNAWQFEDAKQTWAGLASEISQKIETALSWRSRQWLKLKYAWKERQTELILNALLPAAVVAGVAGLVILGFFRNIIPPEKIDTPLGVLLKILLPTSSLLFAIWFVSSQVLKVAAPVSERVLSYVRLPDYREQMGFQNRVKDDLKFVYDFLLKRRAKCRVVVYIDDLDRCSEKKIMELLQAINLILASNKFFVFVGMDTEMIYRAINSYYDGKMPPRFAENYLRKIIQISFFLPPETAPEARLTYLGTLFSLTARSNLRNRLAKETDKKEVTSGVVAPVADGKLSFDLSRVLRIVTVQLKEVEDTDHELEAFGDYGEFVEDNPREIKRLINIHRLIKILLQKQNTIERQRKLVKWLIFCDRWPDWVDDVLALKRESDSANILAELATNLENGIGHGKSTETAPDTRQLREFADFAKTKPGPPLDLLSAADIDHDFRRAAKLSQLVSESPAVISSMSESVVKSVVPLGSMARKL